MLGSVSLRSRCVSLGRQFRRAHGLAVRGVSRMRLEGKVAVVTGSSTGIGEAIARAFAAEGSRLVINSRSQERASAVASSLSAAGHEAIAVGADVTRKAECERLVSAAVDRWGSVDIM